MIRSSSSDKKDRKQLTRRNDWIGLSYLGRPSRRHRRERNRHLPHCRHPVHDSDDVRARHPARVSVCADARVQPWHGVSHAPAERGRLLVREPVYIIQPTWYRYRHAVHHTYTQIQGMDPAMVLPSPTTWRHYCEQLLGWRLWTTFPVVITKHAFGRMRPQDSWYVPKQDSAANLRRGARHARRVRRRSPGLAVFSAALHR